MVATYQLYMFKVLEYFGFSQKFIQWIKTLYSDSQSCLVNNGHISRYFNLERGVKQGCPLSPYLYILCAEALANAIRHNNGIKSYNKNMSCISLFADDTTLYLKNDGKSLLEVLDMFDKFEKVSGLRVNYDKTEIMKIGLKKVPLHTFYLLRRKVNSTKLK